MESSLLSFLLTEGTVNPYFPLQLHQVFHIARKYVALYGADDCSWQICVLRPGCSGCDNGSIVNETEMNGPFKRPFKAHSDSPKRVKFLGSWTSKGKLEILYFGHQFKKQQHTDKK